MNLKVEDKAMDYCEDTFNFCFYAQTHLAVATNDESVDKEKC